jgi:hypothetical protein
VAFVDEQEDFFLKNPHPLPFKDSLPSRTTVGNKIPNCQWRRGIGKLGLFVLAAAVLKTFFHTIFNGAESSYSCFSY